MAQSFSINHPSGGHTSSSLPAGPGHATVQKENHEKPRATAPQLHRYLSRRSSSKLPDMSKSKHHVGMYSPWALLWVFFRIMVPLSYGFVILVLLRELCQSSFTRTSDKVWLPTVTQPFVTWMHNQNSWPMLEYYCWIEVVFFLCIKLKVKWLQYIDPLEASIRAGPIHNLMERALLWSRMMECEAQDPIGFVTGWFFDCPLEQITKYDVIDFVTWFLFEVRHQEHLTNDEIEQLETFVKELEHRISLQQYGGTDDVTGAATDVTPSDLPVPKRLFRFPDDSRHGEHWNGGATNAEHVWIRIRSVLSYAWSQNNILSTVMREKDLQRQLTEEQAELRKILRGNNVVPARRVVRLMRRITDCHEELEAMHCNKVSRCGESVKLLGNNIHSGGTYPPSEPQHYARYSSDPLLGIASYPLALHVLVFAGTEIPFRVWMKRHGFERRTTNSVSYYFHPGRTPNGKIAGPPHKRPDDKPAKTPIIFVHGIGLGLIVYRGLVETLLDIGRPLLLPELPFISGFRPWQSPTAPLSPMDVVATLTAMLTMHGFSRANWMGHSYGTSWLSHMVQYAKPFVASVTFLDPICFQLHSSTLTRQFVYTTRDPGTVTYIVRTDPMVNYTIQRCFPWSRICLFVEQLDNIPYGVFLADQDALIPVQKIETYFRQQRNIVIRDFDDKVELSVHGHRPKRHCTVFRGLGHGDWTEQPPSTFAAIARTVEDLAQQAEL